MQNHKLEKEVKKQSWLEEGGEGPHWTVVPFEKKNNNKKKKKKEEEEKEEEDKIIQPTTEVLSSSH